MKYEEFKIKMIYKEIEYEARLIMKKIHLFEFLEKIYNVWDKKELLIIDDIEHEFMLGVNGAGLNIPTLQ